LTLYSLFKLLRTVAARLAQGRDKRALA
jgi:hypothetical protein